MKKIALIAVLSFCFLGANAAKNTTKVVQETQKCCAKKKCSHKEMTATEAAECKVKCEAKGKKCKAKVKK